MEANSRELVKAYRTYLSEERSRSAMGVVEKTGGGAAGHEIMDFSGAERRADEPGIPVGDTASRKTQYTAHEETSRG